MCHVWFSDYAYYAPDSSAYFALDYKIDGLSYWNENMAEDTGGARSFVTIASSQDFNGNGMIDIPVDTFTNCTIRNPWGDYGGGWG